MRPTGIDPAIARYIDNKIARFTQTGRAHVNKALQEAITNATIKAQQHYLKQRQTDLRTYALNIRSLLHQMGMQGTLSPTQVKSLDLFLVTPFQATTLPVPQLPLPTELGYGPDS